MKKKFLSLFTAIVLLLTTATPIGGVSPCFTYTAHEYEKLEEDNGGRGRFSDSQVLAPAASYERALEIGEMYGLELSSYSDGIAVFYSCEPVKSVRTTKSRAFDFVSGIISNHSDIEPAPKLSFNYVYTLYDSAIQSEIQSSSYAQWHHDEMNNHAAWKKSTGSGVVIAVIDTGLDVSHPDFEGRILATSYNSHTQSVGISRVSDDQGHGTIVAGISSGRRTTRNNSSKDIVSGTAPDSRVMVIKANNPANKDTFYSSALFRGINYAVMNGAEIINMSLGRPYYDEEGEIDYDELEHQTLQNAVASGVVVVAAAGNESDSNVSFPAAYPEVIAVSATRSGFKFDNSYSNYGEEIDISAPGTSILSTRRGGGYANMRGTSMAAPNVSGTIALLKTLNPKFTPDEISHILFSTAREGGVTASLSLGERDLYYGYGIVDSGRAVELALVNLPSFPLGHVRGRDRIGIEDALEVLRYLAGLSSVVVKGTPSWEAAMITPASHSLGRPTINDVLEILKNLAGINNLIG